MRAGEAEIKNKSEKAGVTGAIGLDITEAISEW
jgi:hypothetical protein